MTIHGFDVAAGEVTIGSRRTLRDVVHDGSREILTEAFGGQPVTEVAKIVHTELAEGLGSLTPELGSDAVDGAGSLMWLDASLRGEATNRALVHVPGGGDLMGNDDLGGGVRDGHEGCDTGLSGGREAFHRRGSSGVLSIPRNDEGLTTRKQDMTETTNDNRNIPGGYKEWPRLVPGVSTDCRGNVLEVVDHRPLFVPKEGRPEGAKPGWLFRKDVKAMREILAGVLDRGDVKFPWLN